MKWVSSVFWDRRCIINMPVRVPDIPWRLSRFSCIMLKSPLWLMSKNPMLHIARNKAFCSQLYVKYRENCGFQFSRLAQYQVYQTLKKSTNTEFTIIILRLLSTKPSRQIVVPLILSVSWVNTPVYEQLMWWWSIQSWKSPYLEYIIRCSYTGVFTQIIRGTTGVQQSTCLTYGDNTLDIPNLW